MFTCCWGSEARPAQNWNTKHHCSADAKKRHRPRRPPTRTSENRKFQRTFKSKDRFLKNPPLSPLLFPRPTHRFPASRRSSAASPLSARHFHRSARPQRLFRRAFHSLSLERISFKEPPGCALLRRRWQCSRTHFSAFLRAERNSQCRLLFCTAASKCALEIVPLIIFD